MRVLNDYSETQCHFWFGWYPDTIYIALLAKCSDPTLITPFTLQLFASTDNCLVGDAMTISMPNSHWVRGRGCNENNCVV